MLTGLGLLPPATPLLQPTAALLQPQVLLQPRTAMQQQRGQWQGEQGGQVVCGWRCRLGLFQGTTALTHPSLRSTAAQTERLLAGGVCTYRPQAVQHPQPAAAHTPAALLLPGQEARQVPQLLLLLQALLRWVLVLLACLQQDSQANPVQEGRVPEDSMCHRLWGLWATQQHLAAAVLLLLLLLRAQHAQQGQGGTPSWGGSLLGAGPYQPAQSLTALRMEQHAPAPQQQQQRVASSLLMRRRLHLWCPPLSLSRLALCQQQAQDLAAPPPTPAAGLHSVQWQA